MYLNYLYYLQQIETSLAGAARSAGIGEASASKTDVRPRVNPTMAVAMTAREVEDGGS